MIDDLKISLLGQFNYANFSKFQITEDSLFVVSNHVAIEAFDDEITIYCTCQKDVDNNRKAFLTKENTIKRFSSVSSSLNYIKYLLKVLKDVKLQLYTVFLFEMKKMDFEFKNVDFFITSNSSLRCDLNGLKCKTRKIQYNLIFIARDDYYCELNFYPENPLWDEVKLCPETEIFNILAFISNLKVDNYSDIKLIEQ